MGRFSENLFEWYKVHHRKLPWRETADPYEMWVAEIILQQTRVNQGLSYYIRFLERFPDVAALADADENEVLKVWQGLGYYSRARNMMKAARMVMEEFDGSFPVKYEDLIRLPGVGDYTASAVSSFAGNEPNPVIDGNVQRVISRIYGIGDKVNSSGMKKKVREALEAEMDKRDPGLFNQAIMEFGAVHCVPASPDCVSCIFSTTCFAYSNDKVGELPARKPKKASRDRYFHYIILVSTSEEGEKVLMQKRVDKDIWAGLWEFPLIEAESPFDVDNRKFREEVEKITGIRDPELIRSSKWYKHKLSHQNIHARFFLVKKVAIFQKKEKKYLLPVNKTDIHEYPTSRLIEQFMESHPEWFSG